MFVSSVMSLSLTSSFFNMLSRFVITFLSRSSCLLISWLQSPSTVNWSPRKESLSLFPLFPQIYLPWNDENGCHILSFLNVEFVNQLFHSLLSPSSRGSLVPLLFSAIRVVSSVCLSLQIFLPAILIPACESSSPAFCMMYSAYTLNKQDDNIQSWHTLVPIWNQSIFWCLVLTVASWPVYRFCRRHVGSLVFPSF